jgi:non-specific serine/threonine protein kinase
MLLGARAVQSGMTVSAALTPASLGRLGRFELTASLGRSERSMAWRAHDPRIGQELLLVMPRQQPPGRVALDAALAQAQHATRLSHPHLVHAVEVGEQERWPYIAYDVPAGATLAERRRPREGDTPETIARWVSQLATALAFAHDAGFAHYDLQPWLVVVGDNGAARLAGLGAALAAAPSGALHAAEAEHQARRGVREAAERDVLALALLLHGLLAGAPALGEPDISLALQRLAPQGRDPIRLPWDVPRPVPEALRTIANRATDRQVRQRYRNARTLARSLEGWLDHEARQGTDAHAQLIERVRQLGVLPAMPGAAVRAARLALMERQHNEELAQLVLNDAALTLELLRAVNSAQVRGTQVSGNGPVLTVRRAIAMIGLEGVRRCALAMRNWPGPLDAQGADELQRAIAAAQRAARLAQALRPAGYDLEMVALVTLLQNLGRLVLHYHGADDMRQLRRLMAPAAAEPGGAEQPGMSEQAAAYAVLGCDIDGIALAVARWMGLAGSDDTVLQLMRRLPLDKPVRTPDGDDGVLRAVASAANEAVDALALPAERQAAAIALVAKRYARVLDITPRDLTAAVQASAMGARGAAEPAPANAS